MILFDYGCRVCGAKFEALVEKDEKTLPCPSCKTGTAERLLTWRGGMRGRNKGKYPYFDTQLGITVDSSQHLEKVAKERGLIPMGKEEWERSRNAPSTPDPMDSDEPSPEFIEMAKRTWDDVKFGRVPNEEERVMDIAKECEADFLDATPEIKPS